jgi:hypothetical protein
LRRFPAEQAFFRAPWDRERSGEHRAKPHGTEVDWRAIGAHTPGDRGCDERNLAG